MDHRPLAEQLTEALALGLPPVALAFRDAPPEGVAATDAVVPSACSFWRAAEQGVFFASVDRHASCPIGALVMGFELTPEVMQDLEAIVGRMTECGYLAPQEPASIPVGRRKAAGILYGPLADFPTTPDVVLVWLTPAQAMIWSEAAGGAAWDGETGTVLGRPACAALPAAIDRDRPTLSLGCTGMRTFTGIPEGHMLGVVPGERLGDLTRALARAAAVNHGMRAFYEERRAAVQG
jgi:uncharacterized protein (DUF169 family)